jgi:hypothetical protein
LIQKLSSHCSDTDSELIILKQELNQIVKNFTTQGLSVMEKWSLRNIRLLIQDRCNTILKKALSILEGLCSFWTDMLDPISWPNITNNSQLLMLLNKIFFTTNFYSEIKRIIQYFELPQEEILKITSKIINNNNDNNETHLENIKLIDLSFLEYASTNQSIFITETLTSFQQILEAQPLNSGWPQ